MEKAEFNTKFGQFVKDKRNERNWSQAELASRMNNNAQNISRLERGEISPTFYWVYELSLVFDENLTLFVEGFKLR